MDEASTLLTVEWGFNLLLTIVIAVGGFFVRMLSDEMGRRSEQMNELTQRIVVLEERERGSANQIAELKATIDNMADDMRYVRETVAVLLNKTSGADVGG